MRALKNNWLRAILFSILGLGISFGANASTDNKNPKTVKKEVKVLTLQSWDFNGTNSSSASDYQHALPTTVCGGDQQICQIQAPADLINDPSGNTPDLDAEVEPGKSVRDFIAEALTSKEPNKYVSMKP